LVAAFTTEKSPFGHLHMKMGIGFSNYFYHSDYPHPQSRMGGYSFLEAVIA